MDNLVPGKLSVGLRPPFRYFFMTRVREARRKQEGSYLRTRDGGRRLREERASFGQRGRAERRDPVERRTKKKPGMDGGTSRLVSCKLRRIRIKCVNF